MGIYFLDEPSNIISIFLLCPYDIWYNYLLKEDSKSKNSFLTRTPCRTLYSYLWGGKNPMTKMQTVSKVSKNLGISSRMLRYYEQVGLIESQRMEDYAYRVYDEKAIRRLRQIIILRKLRVPVKQIREIFGNSNAVDIIEIFERNISELDEQITALSTVKSLLSRLVSELHEKANMRLQLDYLGDNSVFAVVDSVSFPNNTIQSGRSTDTELLDYATEEEKTMTDLNKANESLNKLNDSDVRIVYVPPMTVASYYFSGTAEWGVGPEATMKIEQFVQESNLLKIKPDARGMGFDRSRDDLKPELTQSHPHMKHGCRFLMTWK